MLRELEGAAYAVLSVEQRDVRRQPFLPYTTSTLQQDASVRLRFKPKRTMSLAQQLYEGIELGDAGHQGLITYMRTDSTRISDRGAGRRQAIHRADASAGRTSAPGARSRARPKRQRAGRPRGDPPDRCDADARARQALPDAATSSSSIELIWRRFVAAFMAPAVFDTLRVDIAAATFIFRANGSTLKFPGFYAVWPREQDGDDAAGARRGRGAGPAQARRRSSTSPSRPPRFTEASLIKELEERGIGRPSTYVPHRQHDPGSRLRRAAGAPLRADLARRDGQRADAQALPRDRGRQLHRGYGARLDAVEEGKQGWTEFLKDFYAALREQLERAEAEMDRVQKPVEEANEACPQCGKPLLIRSGRFGRFISCSGYPECDFKKPLVAKTGALCPKDGGDLVERRAKVPARCSMAARTTRPATSSLGIAR